MRRVHGRIVSTAAALLAGLALLGGAPQAAQAAAQYVVNDGGPDCGALTPNYSSIQMAVDDAKTNHIHTILVCPGNYHESISLLGVSTLTISAPAGFARPVIAPAPSSNGGYVFDIVTSTGITLSNLDIDGTGFLEPSTSSQIGLYITSSAVTLQNVSIASLRNNTISSLVGGYGIYAMDLDGDKKVSSLTITHSYIYDYQTDGVDVYGNVKTNIFESRIDGADGSTPIRTNGVLLTGYASGVPTGSISKSILGGNGTDINLMNVGKISMTGNLMSAGVNITTDCGFAKATASGNKISGNTFGPINITGGIGINANITGSTTCDPTATGTVISGNTFLTTNHYGTYVGYLVADPPSGGHKPTTAGTVFTKNRMFGFVGGLYSGGTSLPPDKSNIFVNNP